jgi:hypothetical protein
MPANSNALNDLFNIIQHATLPLPALEVTMLLVILTACLLFRFSRMGLFTAYIFTYRWGWTIFAETKDTEYLTGYLVLGVAAGILAVIGMLYSRSDS